MQTLSEVKSYCHHSLSKSFPEEEIDALFYIIVEHVLGLKRLHVNLRLNDPLRAKDSDTIAAIVVELLKEKPIQHVLGVAPFYGMEFHVNQHTLIPRPETEELVDRIIQQHKEQGPLKILDIGTGSGCIAVALAKHLPSSTVTAVDISGEALDIAGKNAQELGVDVDFIQGDILQWEGMFEKDRCFDIIVSNPPYISEDEKKDMSAHVLEHEPHSALFVDGNDPLLFYDKIADFAVRHLSPSGGLYLEINQYLPTETLTLIQGKGFNRLAVHNDINGAARMLLAYRK